MGKSKPRTRDRARNRDNPAGKPVKPPADPELAAIREQRILPVLKDLQSAELKTRSAAASAISNIIEDTKSRKLLLREQIVKIIFEQTLTDSSLETRSAGWGILRNLALEEEADFCIHLYRQDVLTSIDGVIRTVCTLSSLGLNHLLIIIRSYRQSRPESQNSIVYPRHNKAWFGVSRALSSPSSLRSLKPKKTLWKRYLNYHQ